MVDEPIRLAFPGLAMKGTSPREQQHSAGLGDFTSLSCSRLGIGLLAQEDPIKFTITRPTRSWVLLLPLTF